MMDELPDELLSGLGNDKAAMLRYAGLKEEEKDEIANGVRHAISPHEIENIINKL